MQTRHTFIRFLASLCIVGAVATGSTAAQAWEFGKTVSGSGQLATVQREASGFNAVSLKMGAKVELVQGDKEGVTIEADDNIVPLIETSVESGQLVIRGAKNTSFKTNNTIKITVFARTVEALAVSGSGDIHAGRLQSMRLKSSIAGSGNITLKALQVDNLSVSIAGSGNFLAEGAANQLDGSIAGSGDMQAALLSTKAAKINIAGSGNAVFWVRESLSVSIAGSGDVRYYGEGQVNKSSVSGSGRVSHLGVRPAAG